MRRRMPFTGMYPPRRSSVRPYPREEPQDGLHREDVDGDGRVLMILDVPSIAAADIDVPDIQI